MSRQRILIIEDDAATRHLCGQILKPRGAIIEFAEDGEEALEMLADAPPDLILLDIALPKVDGWEILESVRGNPETVAVPIIVITAHGQGSVAERALRGGADRFFEKPFWPPELSAAVDTLLGTTPVEGQT